jgi:hypothetical protein
MFAIATAIAADQTAADQTGECALDRARARSSEDDTGSYGAAR